MLKNALIALLISSAFSQAWGAACCGGGLSVPALIVGDERAMLNASYNYSELRTDVSGRGIWRDRDDESLSQTLRLEGAHIFRDRYQAGLSLPVVRRSVEAPSRQGGKRESTGLGDVSLNAGYEYLPEWDYSSWRPRGLGFLQLTLPTGTSIYESNDPEQLDARGRGFWALGAGTALSKVIRRWDTSLLFEVHRSFSKRTDSPQGDGSIRLEPGWGGNLTLGGGWNKGDFRLGGSLSWTYEDAVDVSGALTSDGSVQRFATAAITASYLYSTEWLASATYSDQTLFGAPVNTTLSRAVLFSLQRKWSR